MGTDVDSARADVRRVAAHLKRHRPAGVTGIDSRGREIQVALVGTKYKWEKAAKSLLSTDAVQARLYDHNGAVLDVYQVRPEEPEDEEAAATTQLATIAGKVDPRGAELTVLMKIALDAADRQTSRLASMFAETLGASVTLMQASADRAERLEKTLSKLMTERERELEYARREYDKRKRDGADDDDEGMQLLGMLLAARDPQFAAAMQMMGKKTEPNGHG
jgi:hypothetical protein